MRTKYNNGFVCELRELLRQDAVVTKHKNQSDLTGKLALQILIAFSFFIFSITNTITKSYFMLMLTTLGFAVNAIFAAIAYRKKNGTICSRSVIITCSLLFLSFVIYGGNDGFACLWIVLLPLFSMAVMDFSLGLCVSLFIQLFLMVVFWTPIHEKLLYSYNEQFCIRFPLFFLVAFCLGLELAVSLLHSQYRECLHMTKLEELNKKTLMLSHIDPLTSLANRRYAYEQFKTGFVDGDTTHCVVMGDIDNFKSVNDCWGHEFGDEVLITISNYMTKVLPEAYLKSRWGGEEFLFAANESLCDVYQQIETLRKAISGHAFKIGDNTIEITMTFGIAEYTDAESLPGAINLADQRLYIGKNHNKNCTVFNDF